MKTETKKYLDNAKKHLFKTEGEDKFFKIFYEGDIIRKQYYDILEPHDNTDELRFDCSLYESNYDKDSLCVIKHILFNPDKKYSSVKHFKSIRETIGFSEKKELDNEKV